MVGKNAELEKARAQGKYIKPFETGTYLLSTLKNVQFAVLLYFLQTF